MAIELSLLHAGAITAAIAWATWVEPAWIQVRRCSVPIAKLPPNLAGLRLALISDTHAGGWAGSGYYRRAAKLIAAEEPDAILLAGDIVVSHASCHWLEQLQAFGELTAPLGKYAVSGGHDRSFNYAAVTTGLQQLGFVTLENQACPLTDTANGLWLIGLADNTKQPGLDNYPLASRQVPSAATKIVLVHSSDAIFSIDSSQIALLLCGHTHGGQVRVPFFGAPIRMTKLPRCHDQGLSRFQSTWIYVTRGLGSSVRLRFSCRPEISLITLQPADTI